MKKQFEEMRLKQIDARLAHLRESLQTIEPLYRQALASKITVEKQIKRLENERFNYQQTEFDFSTSAVF